MAVVTSFALVLTGAAVWFIRPQPPVPIDQSDIISLAYAYPDGGGWKWEGSGCPERIEHKGVLVVDKAGDTATYCNGFTFAVVMKAAGQRGLLGDVSIDKVWAFQKQWYAATEEGREMGAVSALENTGMGRRVTFDEAVPGDFVHFQRIRNGTAHSAIFLGWIEMGDRHVGFRYRGSQPRTNGIGDNAEYFTDTGFVGANVTRDRTYIGRLASGVSGRGTS
ncbi:MAG: hypothetical protein Kow00105_16730 [Phycisphaeraceae bacterium]